MHAKGGMALLIVAFDCIAFSRKNPGPVIASCDPADSTNRHMAEPKSIALNAVEGIDVRAAISPRGVATLTGSPKG